VNTYWHFSGPVLRDGSPLPAVGEHLPWLVDIHPCKRGYHASVRPLDALRYAPGPWVARVRLHGETIEHGSPVDKLVAQSRECVTAYVDASNVLREFSMWSALQVIDLWDAPDVVQRYLAGGGESIGAAWVARAAVRAAAEAAAWAAEDAAAEPKHGCFMSEACAGRWLVEGRDECLGCEEIGVLTVSCNRFEAICDLEQVHEFVPLKVLEREDVASGEAAHSFCPPGLVSGHWSYYTTT